MKKVIFFIALFFFATFFFFKNPFAGNVFASRTPGVYCADSEFYGARIPEFLMIVSNPEGRGTGTDRSATSYLSIYSLATPSATATKSATLLYSFQGPTCYFGEIIIDNASVGLKRGGEYVLVFKSKYYLSVRRRLVFDGVTMWLPERSPTYAFVSLAGDLNNDNQVNNADFNLFAQLRGTSSPKADFNRDGTVDGEDFKLLQKNYLRRGETL